MPLTGGWKMSKLPMNEMPDLAKMNKRCAVANTPSAAKRWVGMPVMYEGTFTLKDTGDTFLNMSGWGKGIVFVNGHNLGRYWHVGPQQTLYVPGVWLNKGENKIVIFEQLNDKAQQSISAQKSPILDKME
jgi:beta-galactosidase